MQNLINDLKARDELLVVTKEVDPTFELAAVTRAVQRSSNKTVLFETVQGSDMPVISNIYNNRQRLCEFVDAPADGFCPRWNDLHDQTRSWQEQDRKVIDRPADLVDIRISDLPQITYHGRDAGPYLTSAIFLARHPDTGVENLSFHRSMMVSDDELRIRLGSSHDLHAYQKAAEDKGEALDAVMLIGVEPALFLAGGASLPGDWSEVAFASAINNASIPSYKARASDLLIPATTQIVIEGRILPYERRAEGPFGEFMGYYVEVGENHVFEVLHVYSQPSPVFHSLLCGSNEDISLLEGRTAAKAWGHLNNVLPGIVDVACAPSVMNTTIKIKQQYEGHARQVLMTAFGAHLDYNKVCIVVDEDVDIFDLNEVMWAFTTRGRADQRTLVIPDVPGFYRDDEKDHWGRLGLDATWPFHRAAEFQRKTVPGQDDINLADYL
jgi:UbiD family decarboxylase